MNQASKPRVLIVDDENFYTEVLDNLLRDDYDIEAMRSPLFLPTQN